jgi:hypothetical protein
MRHAEEHFANCYGFINGICTVCDRRHIGDCSKLNRREDAPRPTIMTVQSGKFSPNWTAIFGME